MRKAKAVLAAFFLAGGCAGVEPQATLPDICELRRGDAAAPAPATFIALLLRGYDPATRRVTTPALDCTGAQVRWESAAFACADSALARTALAERPLGAEDVITTDAGAGRTLLWIPTTRFSSGDAMGPVALVEATEWRLRVIALGSLRGYPRRARLRLESLGGVRVLVAEGESCTGTDPASCVRAARVVPLREGRFAPTPLLDGDGRCQSPAWFDLARVEVRRVEGRGERLELSAALVFGAVGLTVEEQVVGYEAGARAGDAPPRILHRAQAARTIQWRDGRLVASGPSLWSLVAGGR